MGITLHLNLGLQKLVLNLGLWDFTRGQFGITAPFEIGMWDYIPFEIGISHNRALSIYKMHRLVHKGEIKRKLVEETSVRLLIKQVL